MEAEGKSVMRRRWRVLALAVGIASALPALAEPVSLQGLTFSDELGGLRIVEARGRGSLDDPFVLVEDITADGPAILTIRGMTHRFGNRVRSHHEIGFALTKVVRNRTEQPWSLFNLELREFLDYASPFGDGLSFGQASDAGRPFRSEPFRELLETNEPFDGVQFSDGVVAPGGTTTVSIVITDTTPRWEFFLLQTQDSPLAAREPVRDSGAVDLTSLAWTAPGARPKRRRLRPRPAGTGVPCSRTGPCYRRSARDPLAAGRGSLSRVRRCSASRSVRATRFTVGLAKPPVGNTLLPAT